MISDISDNLWYYVCNSANDKEIKDELESEERSYDVAQRIHQFAI